jgi:hypothetical protein
MNFIAKLSIAFIAISLLTMVGIWIWASTAHYTNKKLERGEEYKIGENTYKMPDIETIGDTRLLKEDFLLSMKNVMIQTHTIMKEQGIEYFMSGGSLISLGTDLYGTFMPWDDDIDIHTFDKNRKFLFSAEFQNACNEKGIEAIKMRIANTDVATKEGAAVRLRKIGTLHPVLDIFFEKEHDDGTFQKIDSWNHDSTVLAKREHWDRDWVLPLQTKEIDGMQVWLPNKPTEMIHKQYSEKALNRSVGRNLMISHGFPYVVLRNLVWERTGRV